MLGDTHVWLLRTPKPEALEEKVISIATVCPRQKTPTPQKTPPNSAEKSHQDFVIHLQGEA